MKKVAVNPGALKQNKVHEYAMRFVFGGLSTVIAGLIAKRFGPVVGGFFLAFPAIFPASATLIETHEKRRMAKAGADGTNRGRMAASIDAKGASIGCVGLVLFALILWKGLPAHNAAGVIALAALGWLALSYAIWLVPQNRLRRSS